MARFFTVHALRKMAERAIQPDWVASTIERPEFVRPDPRQSGAIRAFRRIPEFGDRWLRAVYVDRSGVRVVITRYLGSRRGETPMKRQEIYDWGVVLYYSDESVENWDDSFCADLAIGYGEDHKIVRLKLLNPPRRSGTSQVGIVDRYDPVADALDVELNEGAWRDTEETPDGFLIDFDAQHRIVALEFLGASKLFPEAALERLSNAA
jgi:uncharacterized protein YuzE